MPNNERLLFLLQTLQENTDDETWLTTADLRRVLEMEGCECSIRTLRTDIQSMKNCGYDDVMLWTRQFVAQQARVVQAELESKIGPERAKEYVEQAMQEAAIA